MLSDEIDKRRSVCVAAHCEMSDSTEGNRLKVGDRVVRGPSWQWGNQDGGPGNAGTVKDGTKASSGWLKVSWDKGGEYSYRMVEKEQIFDLVRWCEGEGQTMNNQL